MSDLVWVSNALNDSEVSLFVANDLALRDQARFIEGEQLLKKGRSVPEDACPKRIWLTEDEEDLTALPGLFGANGQYVVSEKAANIFRQFDLGGGALHPVSEGVYHKDNVTRFPGEYYCWIFGNVKTAFLEEESPKAPALVNGKRGWCRMPIMVADFDIAVSRDALVGPDTWMDQALFKSIFISGELGQNLFDAGLAGDFRLKRCRVI